MLSKRTTLGALLMGATTLSLAVPLTPGAWTALPGITTIPGTVLQDLTQPFSFSAYGGTVAGTVQSRVTQKADGTLLFEWRVTNSDASAGAIQDLRLGSFVTGAYDGDWESAGLGVVNPTRAYLFPGNGGFVNFNFVGPTGGSSLGANTSSYFFYLNTNATQYGLVAQYDLTNMGQTQNSGEFNTFAPVPEPTPVAALGIGAVVLLRRRKAAR